MRMKTASFAGRKHQPVRIRGRNIEVVKDRHHSRPLPGVGAGLLLVQNIEDCGGLIEQEQGGVCRLLGLCAGFSLHTAQEPCTALRQKDAPRAGNCQANPPDLSTGLAVI